MGLPAGRGRRKGGAPGGGVGFWPLGPPDGDALMMFDKVAQSVPQAGARDADSRGQLATGLGFYKAHTGIRRVDYRVLLNE